MPAADGRGNRLTLGLDTDARMMNLVSQPGGFARGRQPRR